MRIHEVVEPHDALFAGPGERDGDLAVMGGSGGEDRSDGDAPPLRAAVPVQRRPAPKPPLTDDTDLHLLVDGRRLDAMQQ